MARFEVLLLVLLFLDICLPSREDVRWAVKISGGRSREAAARRLAEERGLEFVGRVDPFPDVFELRLTHKAMEARSVNERIGKLDGPSVDDDIHAELLGHPAVRWASKQIPLKRTKRDFSDPAFPRQWHLV